MMDCAVAPLEAMVRAAGDDVRLTQYALPQRVTVWGESTALSVMASESLPSIPVAVENVTAMVQFAPADRIEGQVFVWVNPPFGEVAMLEMLRGPWPELVRVTVWGALV
jgi:hypothetical protein